MKITLPKRCELKLKVSCHHVPHPVIFWYFQSQVRFFDIFLILMLRYDSVENVKKNEKTNTLKYLKYLTSLKIPEISWKGYLGLD